MSNILKLDSKFIKAANQNPELAGDMVMMKSESSFDCSKFVPHRCKADCCRSCPIENEVWERNKDKLVHTDFTLIKYDEDHVMPLTKDMRCPFNDVANGYKCRIYEDRPKICKAFGNGILLCTSCPYMNRDGSSRNKSERKVISKKMDEGFTHDIALAKKIIESAPES